MFSCWSLSYQSVKLQLWFSLLLCFGLTISCNKAPQEQPDPEIRIGIVAYHDDPNEMISTVVAAEIAAEDLNNAGGIVLDGKVYKVVLVREEVRGGVPEESVAAVRRLINQQAVSAIIGPQWSSDAIPSGEIAENSRVPLIAPISTNPKTTLNRDFVFRMSFMDDFQGDVVASFMRGEMGLKKAAVIYNIADPYSRGIAEAFKRSFVEQYQGQLVAFESFTPEQEDLTSLLKKVYLVKPQVVYIPTFSDEAEMVGKQARKIGIDAIFFGSDGWERRTLPKIPEFEGSYMTTHWSDEITSVENTRFIDRFQERAGIETGDVAALTYDALNVIFEAIRLEGKSDSTAIRNGLYRLGPYEGVSGAIDFIENGDPVKGATILKFEGGKLLFKGIVKPR